MRSRVAWLVGGIAIAVTACSSWSSEPARWELTREADSDALHLRAVYGGSSCTRFEEWRVDESDTVVTVEAIVERLDTSECTADEVYEPATLRLGDELGDRRLTGCRPDERDEECRDLVAGP